MIIVDVTQMMTSSRRKKYSHDALMPTSTVYQNRLQIYQASRRPIQIDKTFLTAHGTVRIIGKIGQGHADVLEAIMFSAEKKGELDGRIKLLVDPAKIRKICGIGGEQLKKLIIDLEQVVVEIKKPESLHIEEGFGHLIDHVGTATRNDGTVITKFNPLGKCDRKMWRVELGKILCQLIKADIWLTYNPAPIASLQSGISQAIARHVLSHRAAPQGGWRINTLITSVAGIELTAKQMRDKRRELRADTAGLAELDIILNGDRVYRRDK